MSWDIILQVILFGIALSMDAFAVSVTDGLVYSDINKKKSIAIAVTFGLMQGIMPLIGYWVMGLISYVAGADASIEAGKIMALIVTWLSFVLLIFIGSKMLIEAIIDLKKPSEEKVVRKFSYKEVFIMGIATAIDALAVGVTLRSGISTDGTIWLHVVIIAVITLLISFIGVTLGNVFDRLLKGKYSITSIIGGIILICLAVWVVVSHYIG